MDVDTLVLALEYVEYTVDGVLTLLDVDVETPNDSLMIVEE